MRPALLIIMMDFLVASLFLYITEPSVAKKGISTAPVAAVVMDKTQSLWAQVSEMEKARDEEMETYYETLLMQSNEDKITLLSGENHQLKISLESKQRRVEEAAKETQAERERLEKASAEINRLIAEKSELHRNFTEKEEELKRNTEQLLNTKRKLTDQTQKTEMVRQNAERLEKELNDQKMIREELAANLLQRDQALSASAADAREAQKSLEKKAVELETLNAQISDAKKTIAEERKRVMEAELARKRVEGDLYEEKALRKEYLEKTKDMVDRLSGEAAARHQETSKKLDDLKTKQTSTIAALNGVEKKIDQMPEMFSESLREIVKENQKVLERNDLLRTEIQSLVAEVDPQAASKMMTELNALKETNQRIEEQLDGIKKATSTESMEQNMKAIEYLSKKQRELQAGIDSQAADALAKSKGIFASVNGARLQIDGSLKSKGSLWGFNSREIKTYPVTVKADGQVYVISYASSLGLDWKEISDKLQSVNYAIRTADTSSCSLGDIFALSANCKVLILPGQESGAPINLYRSVNEIRERALGNLHIFRNSMKSSDIRIETGTTLNESQKVLEFDRTLLGRVFSDSKNPEPGDFVVSSDGHLVGIMKDWKSCTIILEGDLSSIGSQISFSSPRSFLENVRAYRSNCP